MVAPLTGNELGTTKELLEMVEKRTKFMKDQEKYF